MRGEKKNFSGTLAQGGSEVLGLRAKSERFVTFDLILWMGKRSSVHDDGKQAEHIQL